MTTRLAAVPLLCCLALAAGCGGATSSSPAVPTRPSAATSRPLHRVALPATLDRAGSAVSILVRIAGHRYRFLVDTGATPTVIDSGVARSLHLTSAGARTSSKTVGCSVASQPVRLAGLSLGGVGVPAITATASRVSIPRSASGGQVIVGLLGTDVLSKFGTLRIDYAHHRVLLGGPPPTPTRSEPVQLLSPPSDPSASLVIAPVSIHGSDVPLQVDTGSDATLVDSATARRSALSSIGRRVKVGAVACSTTEQPVRIAHWAIGTTTLPTIIATAGSSPVFTSTKGVVRGLLGGDVFRREGRLTIDFMTRQLQLGR